ncbi:MAG: ACT domain-containing protein [Erysipelotrichaceae bacterium]|nr:ACT domain-containing protein [Erysipelotrichaceae bacterium]
MNSDYLIVHRRILPEYLDKVILARNLLERHEAATITEAVQMAGISRNTYYKYKDYVFDTDAPMAKRHAVISMILKDESGSLSSVINALSDLNTNILTISQAIPIASKANVLISLDITNMTCTVDELTAALKRLPSSRRVHLDAIE